MKNELETKFSMLSDLRGYIETESFQTFVMKPIFEELNKLKDAYDCETLRELATVKGKKQGLKTILKVLKQVETDWKNTKHDLENQ